MGKAEAILMIIEFLIDKGIPAVIKLLNEWQKKDPTLADFALLKSMMKRPEDYLTNKDPYP